MNEWMNDFINKTNWGHYLHNKIDYF